MLHDLANNDEYVALKLAAEDSEGRRRREQEAQLMLTTGSRVCRSVEVNKHFGSIPSKIIKNNSE